MQLMQRCIAVCFSNQQQFVNNQVVFLEDSRSHGISTYIEMDDTSCDMQERENRTQQVNAGCNEIQVTSDTV